MMYMQLPRLAAGLLVILLHGCTLAPVYQQPPLPVVDHLPAARNNLLTAGDAVTVNDELGWRDYFTDPRLQQLITSALVHNRDLRTSALTVEAYQAQYRIQRSALFPNITAEGGGSKQRTLNGSGYATSEVYAA